MKKVILILLTINCFGQVPMLQWQKSFGGTQQDLSYKIQQTNDGGYIIAGYTTSNEGDITFNHGGQGDFWVVKTNSNGIIEWQKTYGGSDYEYAFWIEQTNDNGYIIAGYTSSNNGDVTLNKGITDYWVVKINNLGEILWEKTYGGSSIDYAYCIKQTTDGGYILLGETCSNNGDVSQNHGSFDLWVVKLNSLGVIQWSKTYGGSGDDYASMLNLTTDGGYIIAGSTYSNDGDVFGYHGDRDFWFIKINSTGTIQWQKAIGGSNLDNLKAINQTSDGGYIGVGQSYSNDGDHATSVNSVAWVVKISAIGTLQWEKTIDNNYVLELVSVEEKSPGEYILAGTINCDIYSFPISQNYWLTKINSFGQIIWEKMFGGSQIDTAENIISTSDGGYIMTGYSDSLNGDITIGDNIYDFWVVKLSSEQLLNSSLENQNLVIYPNPTSKLLNLQILNKENIDKIIITDFLGKIILSLTNTNQINIENLSNGIYIIDVFSGNKKFKTKFIKQ